ncbi:DDE-type integrase/transposase/recombinase, partial [Bacillus infantis]
VFNQKNQFSKEVILKCPHCLKTLEKVKERKDFDVYKCKNNACTFYKRNLNGLTSKEKKRFKENPQAFKMRYVFRQFHIDYKPLS